MSNSDWLALASLAVAISALGYAWQIDLRTRAEAKQERETESMNTAIVRLLADNTFASEKKIAADLGLAPEVTRARIDALMAHGRIALTPHANVPEGVYVLRR
jgi:hypothetical protein